MYDPKPDANFDLRQRILGYLASLNVRSLRRLEVSADGGTVTIAGLVWTFYEKQLAISCCLRDSSATRLVDQVTVR